MILKSISQGKYTQARLEALEFQFGLTVMTLPFIFCIRLKEKAKMKVFLIPERKEWGTNGKNTINREKKEKPPSSPPNGDENLGAST